eukprot:jgi/Chlat1/6895/Chrsp52S06580
MYTQLQLRLTHGDASGRDGNVTVSAATDLRHSHDVSVEAHLGKQDDKLNVAALVSLHSGLGHSWAVATSHRLRKKARVFVRCNGDPYNGQQIFLQTLHHVTDRDTVSPMLVIDLGSQYYAGSLNSGLRWTHSLRTNSSDKLSLTAFVRHGDACSLQFSVGNAHDMQTGTAGASLS